MQMKVSVPALIAVLLVLTACDDWPVAAGVRLDAGTSEPVVYVTLCGDERVKALQLVGSESGNVLWRVETDVPAKTTILAVNDPPSDFEVITPWAGSFGNDQRVRVEIELTEDDNTISERAGIEVRRLETDRILADGRLLETAMWDEFAAGECEGDDGLFG